MKLVYRRISGNYTWTRARLDQFASLCITKSILRYSLFADLRDMEL